MVHLIWYDLKGHERPKAYQEVARVITEHAPDHKRALYSQWLVNTGDSVKTWYERLRPVIDADDNLLIIRVRANPGHYWGYLAAEIWPWLKARA